MSIERAASVLVVEDDRNTLAGYLEFLSSAGYDVVGAADGAAGLAAAERVVPDALVTDITMPHLDGYGLAAALRADERTRGVTVIGLTAHRTPEVRARAAQAGIETLLLKPCLPAHLLAELDRLLARPGHRPLPATP